MSLNHPALIFVPPVTKAFISLSKWCYLHNEACRIYNNEYSQDPRHHIVFNSNFKERRDQINDAILNNDEQRVREVMLCTTRCPNTRKYDPLIQYLISSLKLDPTKKITEDDVFNKDERMLGISSGNNLSYGPLIEELISFLKSETPDGNVVGQYTLYEYDRTYHSCIERNDTLKATTYYDALYEIYTTNTLGISHCTNCVLMNLDRNGDDDKTNIVPTLLNMPAGMLYHEIKFELIRTPLP